jgi:hypothetical protein
MAISTMPHLKYTINQMGKIQRCPWVSSAAPPPRGGGQVVVPRFSANVRRLRGSESCAVPTVLLHRAGGRRRSSEEGIALNDGGRPGSFNNECKVDGLLLHLVY